MDILRAYRELTDMSILEMTDRKGNNFLHLLCKTFKSQQINTFFKCDEFNAIMKNRENEGKNKNKDKFSTIMDKIYIQNAGSEPGIASYHFKTKENGGSFISYENAPSSWLLDD